MRTGSCSLATLPACAASLASNATKTQRVTITAPQTAPPRKGSPSTSVGRLIQRDAVCVKFKAAE